MQTAEYDSDCRRLCQPNSEAWPTADYNMLMSDPAKVDQIASILINVQGFQNTLDEICFVLPKIGPLDFKKYRDTGEGLR